MALLNRETINVLLLQNDKALIRAILIVNQNQTVDEKLSGATRHHNGCGFRPVHAKIGTSMANFYVRRGYLTDKQIAYWRKLDRKGMTRIGIYWRQLKEAAEDKQRLATATSAII